jgi:hypothetical protein
MRLVRGTSCDPKDLRLSTHVRYIDVRHCCVIVIARLYMYNSIDRYTHVSVTVRIYIYIYSLSLFIYRKIIVKTPEYIGCFCRIVMEFIELKAIM